MRTWMWMALGGCSPPIGPWIDRSAADVEAGAVTMWVCEGGGGEFTDIQPAIDAAPPGAVIGVCAGRYGPIRIRWGDDVDVIGLGGPDVTSIEGVGEPAVELDEGALDLRGFHLRGDGTFDPWFPKAGGFSLYEGTASLRDSVVEGATGPFTVLFDEDFFVMDNVVFVDNHTKFLWYLWQGEDDEGLVGSAEITRNTVIRGTHQSLVETDKLVELTMANNVFADVTIESGFSAFVLRTLRGGRLDLHNNVFYDVSDVAPAGGRLFEIEGHVDFRNNIVASSQAWDLRPMAASYSLFWDNGVDYAPFVEGAGNLSADPQFVDPGSLDFRLRSGSPAIDAGDPDPAFADPDGSRGDLGRHGGPGR